MRILFTISDLTYCGAARQLTLLAKGLPAERFQRRVCVLGAAGHWAEHLRESGVIVDVLNRRWKLDLPALNRLRHVLRAYQADVLHVWGQAALRATALAGGLGRGRLVVTMPLPPRKPSRRLAMWERWLLRRAERVTASSTAEAEKWRQLGLEPDRLAVIPPGVETTTQVQEGSERLSPQTILCIGPLKRHKGFRDAIWGLDMLRFGHPDLRLAFVGDGTDRRAIERFAHDARVSDHVDFLGDREDVLSLLAQAELVWAPCRAAGGINAVLEAMAAGKPVVASQLPEMAAIVAHGETGFLIPSADQAALARQTRLLLNDPELRRRMGEAGHRRVTQEFAATPMAEHFAQLYEAGGPSS